MGLVWAITGAPFTADSARAEAFKQSGGSRGVTLPTDLRVTALTVPGPKVRVLPGGATMPAGYAQAPGQAYSTLDQGTTEVDVAATGAGGVVTKYLIKRVRDPQFEGQAPANPLTHLYDTFEWVSALPTNVPYVPLARLDQPANTATITNAMLTDLRKVANPRTLFESVSRPTLVTDPAPGMQLTYTTETGEWFPNAGGMQYIDIPSWATQMQIEANWIAVLLGPEGTTGWGRYWVDFGAQLSAQQLEFRTAKFGWDMPVGDFVRQNWILSDQVAVPAKLRGVDQVQFVMKANKQAGTAAVPKMDAKSGMSFKVTFKEVATMSDS